MSSFNETVTIDSLQHGIGSVGTSSEALNTATEKKAGKGITVKNYHASQFLFVGKANVSATNGFRLAPGEQIELNIDRADHIYVIGSGADTTYTWISH